MEKLFYKFLVGIFFGLLAFNTANIYQIRECLESKAKTAAKTSAFTEDHYNVVEVVEVIGKYSDGDVVGACWTDLIVKDGTNLKIVQVEMGSKLDSSKPLPKYLRKMYDGKNPIYTPILAELIPPGK